MLIGTNPSYSAGPRKDMLLDENALYYLEVVTTNNEVLRTCESTVTFLPRQEVRVYPNPVPVNGSVTVDIPHDDSRMKEAIIEVFTGSGIYVGQQRAGGRRTTISLFRSPGIYIINVQTPNFRESKKIIAR